jgi:dienelactone hydrolase
MAAGCSFRVLLAMMVSAVRGWRLWQCEELTMRIRRHDQNLPLRTSATSAVLIVAAFSAMAAAVAPLPGTKPLTMEGDIASQLVEGVDKFLLRKIEESVGKRERHWKRDFSSAEAYNKSIEPNRKRLAKILGVVEPRVPFAAPELVATTTQSALVGKGENYEIYAIRWPVLEDPDPNRSDVTVHGEGLLCIPSGGKKPVADIIAIPDADQTPEQIVGLAEGVAVESQFARRLAESGCRVVIPALIGREMRKRGNASLTNREYLYRSAFEVGRHLIGYEVQKVLACVDWLGRNGGVENADDKNSNQAKRQIGVVGYGEGGGIAMYSAAVDPRIAATCVSGYFNSRNNVWREPIDRNVFGLLDQYGDAEVAAMIAPRALFVAAAPGIAASLPGNGGAPASLAPVEEVAVFAEFSRANVLVAGFRGKTHWTAGAAGKTFRDPSRPPEGKHEPTLVGSFSLGRFVMACSASKDLLTLPDSGKPPSVVSKVSNRGERQIAEIDRHTQLVLRESPFVRQQFMKKLYDVANKKDLAAYEKVADEYREVFKHDVIGAFDDPLLPANPRSRKAYDKEKWTGYEVVLDVWPDVFAYGILLVPKDLKPGEKRPVVVCQHGLEGRPQHLVEGDHGAYHDYAAKLAERGFVTFAPQNLYIFQDRFRTLQRKANPLGKTLFSIIIPQHQQITDWLKTLPFVDGERIGFYGLSYGGKSAMRIPPLVKNYCLSICSADFNEWVDKNASTRNPHSYVWTGEYEIFEWDLGSTFNYAEMAALIAPRPFMVERGHFDTVASDETVAHEFAKVRHHYAARLGIGERCEIEWFVGPHTINGKGTFDLLHKHLKWPKQ